MRVFHGLPKPADRGGCVLSIGNFDGFHRGHRALLAKGDQYRATMQFRESLKKRPRYLPSIMALGELNLAKKDYAQALANTKAVLALRPNLPQAVLLHSAALIGTQDYLDARNELAQLESTFPKAREVKLQFGYLELAQHRFPQAEQRFRHSFDGVAG